MRLHTVDTPVYGSSNLQTTGFKIATSAKAFRILSSNLYKYKKRAIIRELCCNAVDGHVALDLSGVTPRSTFDVTLPTIFDQQFSVRDYGIGLSRESVMNLYTTYFASTKSESDEFVGALGLGSKSPFAYTDTFSVTSWFDGIKTTYSAFIKDGEPNIMVVNEEESSEPNGVEVTVPCGTNDTSEWIEEAERVFISFDKYRPNFVNRSSTDIKYIDFSKDRVYVTDRTKEYGCGVFAVMGGVVYPIPKQYWDGSFISLWANVKAYYVKFELGELDITPSREELSLDDDTIANIKARMAGMNTKYDLELDEIFAKSPDIFDLRRQLCSKYPHEVWNRIVNNRVFKGKAIHHWKEQHETFITHDAKNIVEVTTNSDNAIRRTEMKQRHYRNGSPSQGIVRLTESFVPVIVNDIKTGYNDIIRGLHVLGKVNLYAGKAYVFDVNDTRLINPKEPKIGTYGDANTFNLKRYLGFWPNRMKVGKVFVLSQIRDAINAELKAKGLEKVKKPRTGVQHNVTRYDKTGAVDIKMYAEDIDELDGAFWVGRVSDRPCQVTAVMKNVTDKKGVVSQRYDKATTESIASDHGFTIIQRWCELTDNVCYSFRSPQFRRALANPNITQIRDTLKEDVVEFAKTLTPDDVPMTNIPSWVARLNKHPLTQPLYNKLIQTQPGNIAYLIVEQASKYMYGDFKAPLGVMISKLRQTAQTSTGQVQTDFMKNNHVIYRLMNNIYDLDDSTAKNIVELAKI